MQPHYPAAFERDTAGTEAEWLGRLAGACAPHPVTLGERQATVDIGAGRLALAWQPLPPRRIALMEFARMLVSYRFDALPEAARERFMLRFDMYMQRGGG